MKVIHDTAHRLNCSGSYEFYGLERGGNRKRFVVFVCDEPGCYGAVKVDVDEIAKMIEKEERKP